MSIPRRKICWQLGLALIGASILQTAATASDVPESFQVVNGVAIYVGVIPAQVVQGHPREHPEAGMHGGVPAGSHHDHVVVALFDNATGRRIENAEVTASVVELGLAGAQRKLEPMRIADTITYGNYFDMRGGTVYHINVKIRRPGVPGVVEARFTHRHFGD